MSNASALDWTDLDDKAVDTARVLAMDAVQKVGNGHPGTAMSLAPAAYLLFNRVMRHNPADPNWPGGRGRTSSVRGARVGWQPRWLCSSADGRNPHW